MRIFRGEDKMKIKDVFKSFIFLLILVLIIKGLSYVFVPKDNRVNFGMRQVSANGILGEKENTIDVLVIGDSETYSAISPLEMYNEHGFTSYVCGTPAQRLYDSYNFLIKAMDKQKPKVVVLETNAIYRATSVYEFLIANVVKLFPFFDYHDRWKQLSFRDLDASINYTYTDPNKGFKINSNVVPEKNWNYMQDIHEVSEIPESNLKYLKEIRKICNDNDKKLVFLSTPSIKNWNYAKYEGIKEYATLNQIDYYDINIDKFDLVDWMRDTPDKGDHVNLRGAKKVTKYVGNILSDNYNLPDHRGDKNYESWDKDYKEYIKKAK